MAAGDVTPGKRVYFEKDQYLPVNQGKYGKDEHGSWWVHCPRGGAGRLTVHQITEHEDGTITVSPSILLEGPPTQSWHGYLEHGVWREV